MRFVKEVLRQIPPFFDNYLDQYKPPIKFDRDDLSFRDTNLALLAKEAQFYNNFGKKIHSPLQIIKSE